MTKAIKGDFCKLYLRENGSTSGFKIIGCTSGDSITFNTETIEKTPTTTAFIEYLNTYKSGNISSDMVLIYAESGDAQYASTVVLEWDKASQILDFVFEWTEGIVLKQITGIGLITSLSINGAAQEFAAIQITIQISGEWYLDF